MRLFLMVIGLICLVLVMAIIIADIGNFTPRR